MVPHSPCEKYGQMSLLPFLRAFTLENWLSSFSVSLKLGKTVTYPSLKGVLVWQCPCAVCTGPVALVRELDLK